MSGTPAQRHLLVGVWIVIILALAKMVHILSVSCTGMRLKNDSWCNDFDPKEG